MARIFDNIKQELLGTLRATLAVSNRADFCVGSLHVQCIIPKASKSHIDDVDVGLAGYVGLTEAQLDVVDSYDTKCRAGQEAEDGDD